MPITEKQRELRRNHLGSSDIAAVLGVDPWRNAHDVWLEKTGKVEDLKENTAMQAGTMFEDGVLQYAELELGKLLRNQYRSAIGFPIASNIDALIVANKEPVEAKTAGLFGPLKEQWGEHMTDQLPDRIIIQSHVHMLCAEKDICHVVAFLGGRGFCRYEIAKDDIIMNVICEKSIEFWDYVEGDYPPPDQVPSMAFIKRMKREPEKTVDIDPVLVDHWVKAKESLKLAENIKDSAEEQMLAALGMAEAGNLGDGRLLTYFEQCTKRIDSKRLKDELPEIAAQYLKESKFRVPRIKEPKKQKFI